MEVADIEDIKVEQHAAIHFFVRQGKMVKQTLDKLWKAYTTDEILPEKTSISVRTAVQKALPAIPAEELEKTMT